VEPSTIAGVKVFIATPKVILPANQNRLLETAIISIGESIGLIHDLRGAKDVFGRIAQDAALVLGNLRRASDKRRVRQGAKPIRPSFWSMTAGR